jgi:hypothetical protein
MPCETGWVGIEIEAEIDREMDSSVQGLVTRTWSLSESLHAGITIIMIIIMRLPRLLLVVGGCIRGRRRRRIQPPTRRQEAGQTEVESLLCLRYRDAGTQKAVSAGVGPSRLSTDGHRPFRVPACRNHHDDHDHDAPAGPEHWPCTERDLTPSRNCDSD